MTQRLLRPVLLACLIVAAWPAAAAMRTRPVDWTIDSRAYQGVLVFDDAGGKHRPGLLMVPNWMGVNASAVEKAKAVAGRDYVVLVTDVYGRDLRPKNTDEAGAAAKTLKDDRPLLRARMLKALAVLKSQAGHAPLDPAHVGVFGFCFGGTAALELMRSGAAVDGVVTLHAGLATPMPAGPGQVHTALLALNGAADQYVPRPEVAAFQSEMNATGADWQFVDFSGAVHCFAEADAGTDPKSNCRYDPRSAARAFEMLRDFFRERFSRRVVAVSGRG